CDALRAGCSHTGDSYISYAPISVGRQPDSSWRGDRWSGIYIESIVAVLARRPVAVDEPVVYFRSRYRAMHPHHLSRDIALGRKLPAGFGGRGHRRRRPSTPVG